MSICTKKTFRLTLFLFGCLFITINGYAGVDDMKAFLAKMEKESPHPLPSKKLTIPKKEAIDRLVNKNKSQMVYVKGGSFMMGPDKKHKRWMSGYNQPRHKVTLSSYYISRYLVTNADYDLYTKINQLPWFKPGYLRIHYFARSANHPIQGITWNNANAYCQWLAKQTGLAFDLPTEAQWEYAARNRGQDIDWASNDGSYSPGKNTPSDSQLEDQKGNTSGEIEPLPVGQFPPNPLGLYDMSGSIAEWAKNWFYKYPDKPQINPQGPKHGKFKSVRSGTIKSSIWFQGIYYRDKSDPKEHQLTGFRCVINSDQSPQKLGLSIKKSS